MIEGKEKTTVPIPSVGADGEQPISNYTTSIIAADSNEINPQFYELEDDFDIFISPVVLIRASYATISPVCASTIGCR